MARIRSPNYPAISLAEALKRVEQVHNRERQHPAAREVVMKGMGYSGVNGASLGALSAAVKYGLLEKRGKGEDYRVSDRAVAILHPHSAEEKSEAIQAAARAPALFSELLDHFKEGQVSDDNLRAYLVRRGFSQTSLPGVIQSFRDTMELVSPIGAGYGEPSSITEATVVREAVGAGTGIGGAAAKSPTVKVLFDGEQIEVAAVLADAESVERLIRALEANKPLLRPKDEAAN
jgi:hypothetical protein